jgi:transcriptional regulator with XRE-family HTH domain
MSEPLSLPAGKVTREMVADRAGVSVAAVSLALRGRKGVSEATRARVEAVARELGYTLDPAASLLAAHRRRVRNPLRRPLIAWLGGSNYNKNEFEAALGVCQPSRVYPLR